MSAAAVSTRPVPSGRSTARASAANIGAAEQRRAHAPADQHAVLVCHLPRCRRPSGPAEALRALRIAFAQGLRGIGLAGAGLGLGIVAQPELQRVEPGFLGHLVHARIPALPNPRLRRAPASDRERRHRCAPPRMAVRNAPGRHRAPARRGMPPRGSSPSKVSTIVGRDVVERRHPRRTVDADTQPLAGGAAVADRAEHLVAPSASFTGRPSLRAAATARTSGL